MPLPAEETNTRRTRRLGHSGRCTGPRTLRFSNWRMRSGRRQRQANTSTLTCWSPSRSLLTLLIIVPHQSNACCLCWDRADVAPMISNWTCWKKAVIATILLLAISSYQQISCIQFDETDDMIVLGEAWWSWGWILLLAGRMPLRLWISTCNLLEPYFFSVFLDWIAVKCMFELEGTAGEFSLKGTTTYRL